MKKAMWLLLLAALLLASCATRVVDKPITTPDTRPTVTPLGAQASTAEVPPVSVTPFSTAPAQPGSPLPTPALQSPLPVPSGEARTLTVLTHESFAISDEVLQQFEQANNVKVQFIKQGDAGQALTRAILTKNNPEADVLFGVDNTFMSRALEAKILEAYQPVGFADVPQEFKLDPSQQLIPIDYGDVCLNYDKAYFEEKGLTPPQSLADLAKPEYKDLLVVQNPAGSSPGLAFLLATVAAFGEDRWLGFWADLEKNGVKVVEDWSTAYYTEFSGSSGKGPRPIVVSYASSPPAEVIFADPPIDQAPTAAVTDPQTCFRQIEFAGVLLGAPHPGLAERWIDFMLSVPYQEDLPLNQFVYPVNPQARIPEAFVKWSSAAQEPAQLTPETIAANRERWVEEWTNEVLR